MELVEEETVNRALAADQPRSSRRHPRRDHPSPGGTARGQGTSGAGTGGGRTAATLGLTPAPPRAVYPGGMSRRLHERLAAAAARAAAADGEIYRQGALGGVTSDGAGRGGIGGVVPGLPNRMVTGVGTGVGVGAGQDGGAGTVEEAGLMERAGVNGAALSARDSTGTGGAEVHSSLFSQPPLLVRGVLFSAAELPNAASSPTHPVISPISRDQSSSSSGRRDRTAQRAGYSAASLQPSQSLTPARLSPRSLVPAIPLSRAWRVFRLGGPPPPTGIPSPGGTPAAPPARDGDTGGEGSGRPGRGALPATTRVTYRLDRAGRLVPSPPVSPSRSAWAGRNRGGAAALHRGEGLARRSADLAEVPGPAVAEGGGGAPRALLLGLALATARRREHRGTQRASRE
jgi:hypothetical protein